MSGGLGMCIFPSTSALVTAFTLPTPPQWAISWTPQGSAVALHYYSSSNLVSLYVALHHGLFTDLRSTDIFSSTCKEIVCSPYSGKHLIFVFWHRALGETQCYCSGEFQCSWSHIAFWDQEHTGWANILAVNKTDIRCLQLKQWEPEN